ncbi:MAG: 50S ribosomal protein L9 [Candidatus Auribacter fodinae]|jgi:large subunit ribosomal protein L9|uniref:Large ribosomal subunit protein bL9 n=1 Tax=Candidatus Auribacter fodinae TaxID=2093366 RepID=A0A3A4R475_9BACT|nr:MAG: 50S ribosomal protein L9 [Candidatus Auribacter fodinae]
MEIILVKQVKDLGSEGDVVKVADGYARNFLIPQGFAITATKSSLKKIDEIRQSKIKREQKEKLQAQKLAEKIGSVSCTIARQVGEDDKLFGSVTSQDIAKALEKEGIEVDRRKIILEESLRELGVFSVDIKLHPEVTGTVKVWVVKE